jgi:glycerate kinase
MILVAPTSFKGTLGAAEAARAMARGVGRAAPGARVVELPLSDGGPGLIDALQVAACGEVVRVEVTGPLGERVEGRLLHVGGGVVLESADACGYHLVPPERRDPLRTTTYGVGELILAAARSLRERGPASGRGSGAGALEGRIVVGLGGSATVDGGAGMAEALGWRLLGAGGEPIARGGGGLLGLERIGRPASPLALPPVVGLTDVRNPLLGAEGAAVVFGPQKGAGPREVELLEEGLSRLAARIEEDLGLDVRGLPGAGAAGGLGAGLVAFAGGELVPGSAWVFDAVGFDEALREARLLVTGEGCYDAQTGMGKVVGEAVERARARGIPVLIVAGRIAAGLPAGVSGVDGSGAILTADGVEELAWRGAAQLLTGAASE